MQALEESLMDMSSFWVDAYFTKYDIESNIHDGQLRSGVPAAERSSV